MVDMQHKVLARMTNAGDYFKSLKQEDPKDDPLSPQFDKREFVELTGSKYQYPMPRGRERKDAKPGMELRSNKIIEKLCRPIPRQITEQELDDLYEREK